MNSLGDSFQKNAMLCNCDLFFYTKGAKKGEFQNLNFSLCAKKLLEIQHGFKGSYAF